jgi:hypothetical protein
MIDASCLTISYHSLAFHEQESRLKGTIRDPPSYSRKQSNTVLFTVYLLQVCASGMKSIMMATQALQLGLTHPILTKQVHFFQFLLLFRSFSQLKKVLQKVLVLLVVFTNDVVFNKSFICEFSSTQCFGSGSGLDPDSNKIQLGKNDPQK